MPQARATEGPPPRPSQPRERASSSAPAAAESRPGTASSAEKDAGAAHSAIQVRDDPSWQAASLDQSEADERPKQKPGKPLLASEALMEDLAPVEPGSRAARGWSAAVGIGFLVFGLLPLVHLRPGGVGAVIPSFVIGSIALLAGAARVTYRQRAVAMVVLGLLSGALGLRAPGEEVSAAMAWNLLRMVAAIALPGALLFRAHYRAYAGARLFLGVALLAALPFVAHEVVGLVSGEPGLAELGSIIAIGAVVASLAGFMGAETTGAGSYTAPALILVFTAELTLRAMAARGALASIDGIGEVVASAVAFAGASAIASLGLFQIAAWRFAADARRIDVHAQPKGSAPSGGSGDESSGEWSMRE
jgi:hypothetical protein